MSLITSQTGIDLIKKFEGCRLTAYKCAAGVWTIGFGHTNGVKAGQTITSAQAELFLKEDLKKFEDKVNKYNKKYGWSQCEFDALVSFAFNLGSIDQLTANGTRSRSVIADKILLYNKAGGRVLSGLTTRRKAERELFLSKANNSTPTDNTTPAEENTAFKVKVIIDSLRIRADATTESERLDSITDRGVYTIVEVRNNWGRLKSGAGWICLDHTRRL